MNPQLKPAEWVLLGSGAAMFLLTLPFTHWYSYSGTSQGLSIWNTDVAFPLATYMPILGLLVAIQVGLKLANVQSPPQVIGFTWTQIHLVAAAFAVLIWVGWLILDPTGGGSSWGLAFWISFLGSAGLLTGAIMEMMDEKKAAGYGGYPGGYPGQQPPYPGQQQPPYPGQQPPPPPGGPGQPPQQF